MFGQTKRHYFSSVLEIAIFVGVCLTGLFFVFNGYVEFDEGVNLQIPLNLVERHTYATNYNGGRLFDPIITSGPTILVPIAGAFFLTNSTSLEIARMVMFLYLLGTFFAARHLCRSLYGNLAGLLVFILYASIPYLQNFGVAVLGEIPAVFFCLLGIIFLRDKKRISGSLLIGMAILTKTIFFLAAFSLALTLVIEWVINIDRKISRWTTLPSILMVAGLSVVPFFVWEFTKLIALGWGEYLRNLGDFWLFLSSTGINTQGVFSNISTSIGLLDTPFQLIPGWVVLVFLLGALLWVLLRLRRQVRLSGSISNNLPELFLFLFSLVFMIWWILVSKSGWWRHLMPGMMIIFLPFSGLMAFVFRSVIDQIRTSWKAIASPNLLRSFFGVVLSIAFSIVFFLQPIKVQISNIYQSINLFPITKNIQMRFAQSVTSLIDRGAVVGGWGWWQAPEISFLARRSFVDLSLDKVRKGMETQASNHEDIYLLNTATQMSMSPSTWDDEKKYAGEKVLEESGYQLFRYIPEEDVEDQLKYLLEREDISAFRSIIDMADRQYANGQLMYGIYSDGWVSADAAVWLKTSQEQKYLFVQGSAPLDFYQGQQLTVEIFGMGTLVSLKKVDQSGDFSWDIPISQALLAQPVVKITFRANRTFIPSELGITPDGRELSFLVKQIGLK